MNSVVEPPSYCKQYKPCTAEGKNTGILIDALGPFPDEPFFSAIDRTLILSCGLFCNLNGGQATVTALPVAQPPPGKDTCPVKQEKQETQPGRKSKTQSTVKPISEPKSEFKVHRLPNTESKANLIPQPRPETPSESEEMPTKKKSNLKPQNSQSLSNLSDLHKQYAKVSFKNVHTKLKRDLKICLQGCDDIKNHLKVKTISSQGVKAFEIWSTKYSKCPFMVFVVSQNTGEVICFENVGQQLQLTS